jgi:hypothetical protein
MRRERAEPEKEGDSAARQESAELVCQCLPTVIVRMATPQHREQDLQF